MKKIFTVFAAAMMAVSMSAASYGILVNGKTYYAGEPAGEFEGFTQYRSHVQVKSGDYCQLYDKDNNAKWAVDLNGSSEKGFTRNGDKYEVTVDGCYDFYIKLKYGQDELYIGNGSNCGSGEEISDGGQQGGGGDQGGGSQGGGSVEGNPRFYYKMYTKADDTWHEPSEETIFEHGIAEMIEDYGEAYVFVLFQVDGQAGVQYRTEEYMDETHRQVKLVKEGPKDWRLPAGVTHLYLYDEGNDTYTLSCDPIPGKKPADPQPSQSAVENTTIKSNIIKTIIDGQVVIIKDGVRYNLLGAQLQ